jgi:hypothetical protein
MNLKIKSLFLILLLFVFQVAAQEALLEMPTTEPEEQTGMSEIPTELPPADQEPVVMATQEDSPVTPPATATPKAEAAPEQPQNLTPTHVVLANAGTQTKRSAIPTSSESKPKQETVSNQELDVEVENQTGKTIYVTCFSYIKKRMLGRWRWDKSAIYKLENAQSVVVDIDTISDQQDRDSIFGFLAVFENEKDAEESTFQLLDDHRKIDLDLITHLKGKKVIVEIEKYGIAGDFYDYDFVSKKEQLKHPELDFYVENKTGKTILATCFVYQKKAKGTWLAQITKETWATAEDARDDMSVWRFDKTPIIKINPNEKGLIDVDTIVEERDRIYVRGYLAIFDENEMEKAEKSTYELLPARRKLDIGRLVDLKKKKISIYTEQYGILGDFIDYVTKPTKKPDITPMIKGYFK